VVGPHGLGRAGGGVGSGRVGRRGRAAAALRLSEGALATELARIGRAAGRPWSKDHRQACLAALIASIAEYSDFRDRGFAAMNRSVQ
jgi:hypothetical protein